jgi:hypothetical protein
LSPSRDNENAKEKPSESTHGNLLEDEEEIIPSSCYGIGFSLASIGISLVLDKPNRREFLSLYVDGLEGRYVSIGNPSIT